MMNTLRCHANILHRTPKIKVQINQSITLLPKEQRHSNGARTPAEISRCSIKDLAEPRLFPTVLVALAIAEIRIFKVRLLTTSLNRRSSSSRRRGSRGAVQQFVEFTAVQPDAAAGWAVIYFDTLAISHHQRGVRAAWAFHGFLLKVADDLTIAVGTILKKKIIFKRYS
jgi:hypothetical protein